MQRMVWQESRYQTRLLFLLNVALALSEWFYTYYSFKSISINKPDMFFFVWMPVIVYGLSVIYLGFRCFSLWAFYVQNDPANMVSPHRTTVVRYLIIAEDKIYLKNMTLDVKQGMDSYFDTPVRLRTHFSEKVGSQEALDLFSNYTGIEASVIKVMKFLFDGLGSGMNSNFIHYLCQLDDVSDVAESRIKGGDWYTLDQIKRLNRQHRLSAELSGELVHIYTVAMAWKTYDDNGNRRYRIKNYQPTYRLCDIHKWNVDYNDERWLRISHLNADKPFFKIRRFFSRLTSPSIQ